MKTTGCLFLSLVLASAGCIELPKPRPEPKPAPPPAPVRAERPAPPVIPGQVTEANANAKADALDDEIARDEEVEAPAPLRAKTVKEKP